MFDLKMIENDPEAFLAALSRRETALGIDAAGLRDLLARRRTLLRTADELGAQRRRGSRGDAVEAREEAKLVRAQLDAARRDLGLVTDELTRVLAGLPNRPAPTVPDACEERQVVVKAWGEPRSFDFRVRDHVEIGELLGQLDLVRGAKIAGSGFACLRGPLARLHRAIKSFFLERAVDRGSVEWEVPHLVNRDAFFGTAQLPKFEEELYWTEGGKLGLVPTAEVPLTNLHAGEILDEEDLPLRYTALTPCWRREAGSAGRDTRGIIRMHEFHKVELVRITRPEDSAQELELLVDEAEDLLRLLGLPHRRVALCANDLGFAAAATYDLEVWLPSQQRYREISSCSNCTDFQARRMGLRLRRDDGRVEYCHTLNGSGLAVGRTLVAILENFQEADGSVSVPAALRTFGDGVARLEASGTTPARTRPKETSNRQA